MVQLEPTAARQQGETVMTFTTIADVKRANKAIGNHWFSPNTMRFFNSRVSGKLVRGKYFVSSEQMDNDTARVYSIRMALPDGEVVTVGEFGEYSTYNKAVKEIATLA